MLAVSYGAGTNSTAMLVGMASWGMRPDVITFADTGGEKPETYSYIDYFSQWLEDNDMPVITKVKYSGKWDSLEQECLGSGTLPSLAYGFKKCSHKWKLQPQDKFFNNNGEAKEVWAKGGKITKAIGYDAGESHRAIHIREDEKYSYWYPLVEWLWNRRNCLEAIDEAGLRRPNKSACFFCPAMGKGEILQLKNCHPDLIDRAIAIEDAALNNKGNPLMSIKGLGRDWSWKEFIVANEAQREMFSDQGKIPCMCFDGDYGDEED